MTMHATHKRFVRGLAAAVAATMVAFTGLASTGAEADSPNFCFDDEWNAGTLIVFRSSTDKGAAVDPVQGLRSSRYSTDTGEIMWERSTGAIGYEIIRNGTSLGVQDVLSWYMTDLQQSCSYHFEVRAVDRYGDFIGASAVVLGS